MRRSSGPTTDSLPELIGPDAAQVRWGQRPLRAPWKGVVPPPEKLVKSFNRHPSGLTPALAEVMELVCLGLTNQEIAERRFTSKSTVKYQVTEALILLGACNRTQGAAIYARRGALEGW